MSMMKITRREVMAGGLASVGASALPAPAGALGQMDTAIRKAFGEATIRKGRVMLDLPPLVENGNTVPMTVAVDSPMTRDNYVKAIHVFNDKNPQPNVVSVVLGPRAGKATVATRIRLAGTQKLMAIAEMSDGTYRACPQEVLLTLRSFLEDLQP